VDAPLTPDALVRPWRLATLVASLIAAVELVGLLVLGFVLLAKPLSNALAHRATAAAVPVVKKHTAATTAAVTHKLVKVPPVGKATRTRAQTGVLVLNGNGRAGMAHTAAAALQHLGYPIKGAGNAPRSDYATTVVMFRPGYAAEAHRLAHDEHTTVVGPLDGIATSSLHGAKLVLILGA
jgi:hypothetical protein